jgi:hypothetical protein
MPAHERDRREHPATVAPQALQAGVGVAGALGRGVRRGIPHGPSARSGRAQAGPARSHGVSAMFDPDQLQQVVVESGQERPALRAHAERTRADRSCHACPTRSRPVLEVTDRTALIVDDERDIRELLVLTLGRMGLPSTPRPTLDLGARATGQQPLRPVLHRHAPARRQSGQEPDRADRQPLSGNPGGDDHRASATSMPR